MAAAAPMAHQRFDDRLTLMQDRNVVFLDQCPHSLSWWLSNTVSLECRRLDDGHGGDWVLDFDEDGMATVMSHQEEVRSSEDVLQIACYLHETSGRIMLVWKDDEQTGASKQWLDQYFGLAEVARVHWRLGPAAGVGAVRALLYRHTQAFGRLRWCLLDLYSVCGFSMYQQKRSAWLQHGFARWMKFLVSIGLVGHLRQGRQNKLSLERSGEDEGRSLAWASITAPAALALLARWSTTSRTNGGLSDEGHRQGAAQVLNSFLLVACEDSFELRFVVDDDILPQWPRPLVGAHPVSVPVSHEGICDLRPWRQAEARFAMRARITTLRRLGLRDAERAPISDVLAAAFSIVGGHRPSSVFLQLVLLLGRRLDEQLCKEEVPRALRKRRGGIEIRPDEDVRVQEELAGHYMACQSVMKPPPLLFSLASDKSGVHTFHFQTTVLALPDNRAMWLFPQALVVDWTGWGVFGIRGSPRLVADGAEGWRRQGRQAPGRQTPALAKFTKSVPVVY